MTISAPRTNGRLRVAAVGLGWVTTNRHLPALRRRPDVDLIGVVDPNAERVAAVASRLKVRRAVGTGPEAVAWIDAVDAVTIGTPPDTHFALATQFLAAGKHVLVEKPMAMSPLEAKTLVDAANRAGRVLAVIHNFQFARAMQRLDHDIRNGRLGELRGIAAIQFSNPRRRLPRWYETLPLGLFYDESPHLLYLVRHLIGDDACLARAEVVRSTIGLQTPSMVDMRFDAAMPVTATMRFEAPISEWHLAVMGSRRMAIADIFRDVLVTVPTDGEHRAADILRTTTRGVLTHLWGVAESGTLLVAGRLSYGNDEVMRRFVQACFTGQQPDGISAQDGLRIVELQHQVLDQLWRAAA